jgi:transcriptional regulator with XRE-family HTH domain
VRDRSYGAERSGDDGLAKSAANGASELADAGVRGSEEAAARLALMDDLRFGAVVRRVRIRLGWRQIDLAARAGVSASTVSRIERGHVESLSIATVRRVAAALDIRLDLVGRWRGGDLDRLLNARHSALHEQVAIELGRRPGWSFKPEVSFAIGGERGVIDLLAFHPERQALLVIELKTEIADVNELVGTLDRKVRLARRVAGERGWAMGPTVIVSAWLIVATSRTNRRRIQAHATMLRSFLPLDGRSVGGWLDGPDGVLRCLSFWPNSQGQTGGPVGRSVRRVVGRRTRAA